MVEWTVQGFLPNIVLTLGLNILYLPYLPLAMETVDKRDVDLKSTSMEKEGFIRSMEKFRKC